MEANAASLALIAYGKVLMIQRARAPYKGLWSLPGGRREPGESPAECARREVVEELGITAEGLEPVMAVSTEGVVPAFRIAVFAALSFSGSISPSDEISAWGWYGPEDIKGLGMTPDMELVFHRLAKHIDISRPH